MSTRRLALIVAIGVVPLLSSCASDRTRAASGIQESPLDRELPEENLQALRDRMDALLAQASDAYAVGDWYAHAALSYRLLRETRLVPIGHLVATDDILHEYLGAYGVRPLLTYVVDYGHRCRYQDTDWSIACYWRLADAFWRDEPRAPASIEPVSLVVDASLARVNAFSENALVPAADLLFSEFGERHVLNGVTPRGFVRIVGLTLGCDQLDDDEEDEEADDSDEERESTNPNCDVLEFLLQEGLDEEQMDRFRGDVGVNLDTGIRAGGVPCRPSDLELDAAAIVAAIEAETRCLEGGGTGSDDPFGPDERLMQSSGSVGPAGGSSNFVTEELSWKEINSYERTDGSRTTVYEGIGLTGTDLLFVTTSKDGKTVSKETHFAEGDKEVSIEATADDGTKTKTTQTYDKDGNPTGSSVEVTNPDGSKTVSTTDKDGNVRNVKYDKDGNVIEVTDADGNPVEDTPPPAEEPKDQTPAGGWEESCVAQTAPTLGGIFGPFVNGAKGWKDPRVIFPPDGDLEVTDEGLECLLAMLGDQEYGLTKCVSAYTCLHGVDENCECVDPNVFGVEFFTPDLCALVTCSEDMPCDPATGQCKTTTSEGTILLTPSTFVPPVVD